MCFSVVRLEGHFQGVHLDPQNLRRQAIKHDLRDDAGLADEPASQVSGKIESDAG